MPETPGHTRARFASSQELFSPFRGYARLPEAHDLHIVNSVKSEEMDDQDGTVDRIFGLKHGRDPLCPKPHSNETPPGWMGFSDTLIREDSLLTGRFLSTNYPGSHSKLPSQCHESDPTQADPSFVGRVVRHDARSPRLRASLNHPGTCSSQSHRAGEQPSFLDLSGHPMTLLPECVSPHRMLPGHRRLQRVYFPLEIL